MDKARRRSPSPRRISPHRRTSPSPSRRTRSISSSSSSRSPSRSCSRGLRSPPVRRGRFNARRGRSPSPRRRSPPPKRGSPALRKGSPRRGSPSPRRGSPPPKRGSPALRKGSPRRGSPSPRRGSPALRKGSPRRGSPPPKRGSPFPRRGSPPRKKGGAFPRRGSPALRSRSPRRGSPPPRNGSPALRKGSPRRGSPPPKRGGPSPRRGSPALRRASISRSPLRERTTRQRDGPFNRQDGIMWRENRRQPTDGISRGDNNRGGGKFNKFNKRFDSMKFTPPTPVSTRASGPGRRPNGQLFTRTRAKVDRSTTCPFLLRIYVHMGEHHAMNDFRQLLCPTAEKPTDSERVIAISESELQVYTWRDASLREIVDLVKDLSEESRLRNAQLSLKLIHIDEHGNLALHDLGRLHCARPGLDDRKTLQASKFDIGDSISLAVIPRQRRHDLKQLNESMNKELDESMNKELDESMNKELDESMNKDLDESMNKDLDESINKELDESKENSVMESDNGVESVKENIADNADDTEMMDGRSELKIGETNETKIDEMKVDEAKIDEAKIDEAKIDEAKIDEAKIDEAKIDEAKIDEAKIDGMDIEDAAS